MKILLVNKFHYKKGGSETYYFSLAEALKSRGHEVLFFAMKDDEKNISCEQDKYFVSNSSVSGGIKSKLNMVLHIAYSKEAYVNMKQLLIEETPDLVILNLVHKQITLSIIDAIKEFNPKLPIFWTMHDLITVCPAYTMLDGNGNICEECVQGSFKPCVEKSCIKGSKLMSVLSKYEADYIRKRKWYEQIDLYICPSEFYRNKLQSAKFTSRDIITLRNPLPLDARYADETIDEGYILFFGRLSSEKGIKTLIEAANKVKCKLLILGTGPIEEELMVFAKGNKDIEFKGFQSGDALTDFVRKSRCVVLPSEWYENGPYSAMEAMALGKPLIVSGNGGLPELVENNVNGYVYDTSIEGLTSSIEKMIKLSDEEYRKMSLNAVKKAKEMFDADKYVLELENLYKKYRK